MKTSRWRVALNFRLLNDAQREAALAGIQKVAQQSTLFQIPAIAASYASLVAKGAKLSADATTAASDAQVAQASADVCDSSRTSFDRELDTFKTLVENNAKSAADVTAIGLTVLNLTKPSRTPPDPPAALVVKPSPTHGKATVSVAGTGPRGRFAAEVAPGPAAPTAWSSLPGTGWTRKLSGYPSGTQLWVRFARVRYGMQSDWCTPVLVTIP